MPPALQFLLQFALPPLLLQGLVLCRLLLSSLLVLVLRSILGLGLLLLLLIGYYTMLPFLLQNATKCNKHTAHVRRAAGAAR